MTQMFIGWLEKYINDTLSENKSDIKLSKTLQPIKDELNKLIQGEYAKKNQGVEFTPMYSPTNSYLKQMELEGRLPSSNHPSSAALDTEFYKDTSVNKSNIDDQDLINGSITRENYKK